MHDLFDAPATPATVMQELQQLHGMTAQHPNIDFGVYYDIINAQIQAGNWDAAHVRIQNAFNFLAGEVAHPGIPSGVMPSGGAMPSGDKEWIKGVPNWVTGVGVAGAFVLMIAALRR